MASSPLLDCQCVHCDNCITAAEKRRNGYACDRCLAMRAMLKWEWRHGANEPEHEEFDNGQTIQ